MILRVRNAQRLVSYWEPETTWGKVDYLRARGQKCSRSSGQGFERPCFPARTIPAYFLANRIDWLKPEFRIFNQPSDSVLDLLH
jgi:hypothetical protein